MFGKAGVNMKSKVICAAIFSRSCIIMLYIKYHSSREMSVTPEPLDMSMVMEMEDMTSSELKQKNR